MHPGMLLACPALFRCVEATTRPQPRECRATEDQEVMAGERKLKIPFCFLMTMNVCQSTQTLRRACAPRSRCCAGSPSSEKLSLQKRTITHAGTPLNAETTFPFA